MREVRQGKNWWSEAAEATEAVAELARVLAAAGRGESILEHTGAEAEAAKAAEIDEARPKLRRHARRCLKGPRIEGARAYSPLARKV